MSNSAVVARKAEPGVYLTGAHLVCAARFCWGQVYVCYYFSLCVILVISCTL